MSFIKKAYQSVTNSDYFVKFFNSIVNSFKTIRDVNDEYEKNVNNVKNLVSEYNGLTDRITGGINKLTIVEKIKFIGQKIEIIARIIKLQKTVDSKLDEMKGILESHFITMQYSKATDMKAYVREHMKKNSITADTIQYMLDKLKELNKIAPDPNLTMILNLSTVSDKGKIIRGFQHINDKYVQMQKTLNYYINNTENSTKALTSKLTDFTASDFTSNIDLTIDKNDDFFDAEEESFSTVTPDSSDKST